MARRTFMVAIAIGVLAFVGCSKKSDGTASPPPPEETSLPPTAATTTAPPAETTTTTPPAEPSTPSALDPATAAEARVVAVAQGETYWAVYVAVGEYDSPEIDDAVAELASYGIGAFAGDLACDQGATDEFGTSAGSAGVALYFETQPEAQTFADSLGHSIPGIVRVRTHCAD